MGDWLFYGEANFRKAPVLSRVATETYDAAIQAMQSTSPGRPGFWHVNFAFSHDPRQWPEGMRQRYDPAHMPLPANFAERHPFDHGS